MEYRLTSNLHTNIRQFNNEFASFPVLLQNLNQTAHLLADNCCPHDQWREWPGERVGSSIGPLYNDSIHYSHKLGVISNLPRYAMQPSSMLRSCLRAQYLEGWVLLFAVLLGPPLKQILGLITALLHPSTVQHISLTSVLVSWMG